MGTKAGVALSELAQAPVVFDAHRFASGGINAGLCAFDGGWKYRAK